MKIEVLEFRPMDKGVLRGFFTLDLGLFQITDCSYFEKGDNRWFSFPSKKVEGPNSDKAKYYSYIRIPDKAAYEDIQDKVLALLKAKGVRDPAATKPLQDDTSSIPF